MRCADLILYVWMVAQILVLVLWDYQVAYTLTMVVLVVWAVVNNATGS